MKFTNIALLGAAGYAAWYLSQMGVAAGTVRFVFDGVQLNGFTNWTVTMLIQNVSNINLNVNSMSGDIFLNNIHVASMGNFGKITVPGNGEIRIPITVSPDLLSLPILIKNMITGGVGILDFKLMGDVNANGLVLPFDISKQIALS